MSLRENVGHHNLDPGKAKHRSRIWTDVDLGAEGKAQGYLWLPLGTHDTSGEETGLYSCEGIPVVSIKNGEGPRVLLMAGNHGNEYEGQVMLMKLIRTLQPEDVRGQIIFLPAANTPAVRAGRRTSPLDGGNLNRLFPGDPMGGPTSMIAHMIESEILPGVEYAFDFHSGGDKGDYLPCAVIARSDDPARFSRSLELLKVFGMPTSMIIDHSTGGDGALIGACRRTGVYHLSTELGGGGAVSAPALRMAEKGLARLLEHTGVLSRAIAVEPPPPTRLIRRVPARDYVYVQSAEAGLFEPYVGLGDEVQANQITGMMHFPTAPWKEPEPVLAPVDGIVLCRRVPARSGLGDCVFVLGRDWAPSSL
ncbi:succinylglutamate desuccinylase/aspartoacylase family protein [Paraburkholderia aspalathi]|uniref:Succinylglutamate desuccinylase/Aspartoacylase catalytic domain-containing protein n=1 Tax=Paraburkholderia aspalathi TaxID=1324617 RepID=A0A1I7BCL9_9BURK|nr:succinylglutamate desuccinylase/aspartoacylase family protein [Paraburkholderia aspalathi]SFT84925.1 hypothetical protein SAMN05192563_1004359 [Paraburkholderia aspalathi]